MSGLEAEFIPPARPIIGEAEIEAAVRVLRSGRVVQGPEVAAFEEEFGALVDGRHCIAVNSGTSALQLTLMALGFGPGDEVIVPSFSFAASGNAIRLVGAEPVFVDIEPGHASASTRRRSPRRSPRAPSRSCRCTSTATRPRWTGHGDRPAAQPRRRRGRRPGPRRGAQRPSGRRLRHRRLLQLLSDQEHALPRGRHGHHRRRRAGPHPAPAAQPGHGAAVRQRDRRRQHADDRRRRRLAGSAAAAARVDGAAPRQREVPRRRDHRHGDPAGGPRRAARLPPVHRPGAGQPRRRPAAPDRARVSATPSTTRRRSTASSRTWTSTASRARGTCRRPSAPPPRWSRCRCTRR